MAVDFLFEPIADAVLTSAPGMLSASGGYVYGVVSDQAATIAAFAVDHPIATLVIATVAVATTTYCAIKLGEAAKPVVTRAYMKASADIKTRLRAAGDDTITQPTGFAPYAV